MILFIEIPEGKTIEMRQNAQDGSGTSLTVYWKWI